VEKGKWYAVDRRTTRRHFLFAPDEQRVVENAFWYCVGLAAEEHGVQVAAAVVMSTHWHLVVQDPLGRMPLFFEDLGRHFALFIKAFRGWPGEVLNKSAPGQQELLGVDGLLRGLSHAIANAAEAGAVRYSRDWPGALTRPEDLGRRVIRATLPEYYFDPDNPRWPKEIELELTMPEPLEEALGTQAVQKCVADQVHRRERNAWQEAKRKGLGFSGVRRCLRRKHTDRANSYEALGALNPTFTAAGDADAAAAAVQERRRFNTDYDEALAQWCAGNRNVVFPHGTWWMRVHHRVRCRPPPVL